MRSKSFVRIGYLAAVTVALPGFFRGQAYGQERPLPQIFNGNEAPTAVFPWHAGVLRSPGVGLPYNDYTCGATLISPRWLLTAAHCVTAAVRDVVIGTQCLAPPEGCRPNPPAGTRLRVKIFPHPDARDPGNNIWVHDIALLQLAHAQAVSAANLPSAAQEPALLAGELAISGWGFQQSCFLMRPHQLRSAVVKVNPSACPPPHRAADRVCAVGGNNEDTNDSDSGGPLSVRWNGKDYLVGVTSSGASCDAPKRYGSYTRVVPYLEWIRKTRTQHGW